MITTIIFDLSEVYLGGLKGIETLLNTKYGTKLKKSSLFKMNETNKLFHGEISESAYWLAIIKEFKLEIGVSKLKATIRENFREINGTREIIVELKEKGFIMGLLSTHAREWIEYCESHFNLHKLFDFLLYSFNINICKPRKEPYEILLRRLNTTPSECIFIDDSAINLSTAEDLGMITLKFKNAKKLKRDLKTLGIM